MNASVREMKSFRTPMIPPDTPVEPEAVVPELPPLVVPLDDAHHSTDHWSSPTNHPTTSHDVSPLD